MKPCTLFFLPAMVYSTKPQSGEDSPLDGGVSVRNSKVKNSQGWLFLTLALITSFMLSACFSPWTGDSDDGLGTIIIGSGGTALTELPTTTELAGMTYKVHFSGPGGSFDREFGPSGGVERLSPGSWRLAVKAYTAEPRLRGITDTTITISGGGSHTVALESCIGIKTEADLLDTLAHTTRTNPNLPPLDTSSGKGDLLVLEDDINLTSAATSTPMTVLGAPVTIIAEPGTSRTIAGDSSVAKTIIIPSGQTLKLGRAGETGTLTIDCNNNAPAAIYASGGTRERAGNTHFARLPVTVGFSEEGGAAITAPNPRIGTVNLPPVTSKSGFIFAGWYTASSGGGKVSFPYVPDDDVTLHAQWVSTTISSTADWTAAMNALNTAAAVYLANSLTVPQVTLTIGANLTLSAGGGAGTVNPILANGVDVVLAGTASITLSGTGSLLNVVSGAKITLGNGVSGPTLTGHAANNAPLVLVGIGGTFTLANGKITDNKNSGGTGGGISSLGTLVMSGGSIEGCSAASGGGVYIGGGGAAAFTMSGGTIGGAAGAGNTASGSGGGVYVTGSGSTFTMSGNADISDNIVTGTGSNAYGGGVFIDFSSGPLNMSGGFIRRNTTNGTMGAGGGGVYSRGSVTITGGTIGGAGNGNTAQRGGGLYIIGGGTLSMSGSGGSISNNTASIDGGGVYYNSSAVDSILTTGTISNNTATGNGGGMYINAGTLTLAGTTSISGNKAESTDTYGGGGGVYVYNNGTVFKMTGGSITQNHADDAAGGGVYVYNAKFEMSAGTIGGSGNANTALNGGGAAIARVGSGGVFDMSGGTISYNTAIAGTNGGTGRYGCGGGVYNYSSDVTFTMSGTASIGYNKADGGTGSGGTRGKGGGVYLGSGSTTKLTITSSDVQISNNQITHASAADSDGAGVYLAGGTLVLTSPAEDGNGTGIGPVIRNNTVGVADSNVYLGAGGAGSITGTGVSGSYTTIGVAW